MNSGKLTVTCTLFRKRLSFIRRTHHRNIQVCVVGAASNIGQNLALLLKQNDKISKLHIYDDDERVLGIGTELKLIPGVPDLEAFAGDAFMPVAIRSSDIVVMVSRIPRKIGFTRKQMLASNAPAIQKLCQTIASHNPDALLAISTNPINSIIPFASALLFKYNAYNPHKLFGVTQIDSARARALTAKALNVNPRHLYIPVVCGHSDETIVPLFSNLSPSHYSVDLCQADTIIRLVRKAGTEILNLKQGFDTAVVTMAWSINDFLEKLIDTIYYEEFVIVNSFTSNPRFGTRFFSGPVKVGPYGIIDTSGDFSMSEFERNALSTALPKLNEDVAYGEEHARVIDNMTNFR